MHLCSEEKPKRKEGEESEDKRDEEMHRSIKIATGSWEDPSGSLRLTASSHWAVIRHM